MKIPKDNFSDQASHYKKFRPTYPYSLYDYLLKYVDLKEECWDCGTGNGQVADVLSESFQKVCASDISQKQIDHAPKKENIHYSIQPAEQTSFSDDKFDLITVAQAVHWFDFEKFNVEVLRVGKPGAVVCFWGYSLLKVGHEIDQLITEFDKNIVGPYWDAERKHIDSGYRTIPFDYDPIDINTSFAIHTEWDIGHLQGYFESWSCVQNYIRQHNGESPVPAIMERLTKYWPADESRKITFPIFIKMGRIRK